MSNLYPGHSVKTSKTFRLETAPNRKLLQNPPVRVSDIQTMLKDSATKLRDGDFVKITHASTGQKMVSLLTEADLNPASDSRIRQATILQVRRKFAGDEQTQGMLESVQVPNYQFLVNNYVAPNASEGDQSNFMYDPALIDVLSVPGNIVVRVGWNSEASRPWLTQAASGVEGFAIAIGPKDAAGWIRFVRTNVLG